MTNFYIGFKFTDSDGLEKEIVDRLEVSREWVLQDRSIHSSDDLSRWIASLGSDYANQVRNYRMANSLPKID